MLYKKNINGILALGYGSKYQLLRMLGWHRNEFNKEIAKALNLKSNDINWLDFGFNGPCDTELLNVDFIPELKDKWRNYWMCGKGGLNFDAVGISNDGSYIFVEAKAHLSELNSEAKGSSNSKENNIKRIKEFIDKYHIDSSETLWSEKYYQLANRLVITDFLNTNGKKAYLIYVLFENGFEYNRLTSDSASKEEWINAMEKEIKDTGILGTKAEKLVNYCIINCNKNKNSH